MRAIQSLIRGLAFCSILVGAVMAVALLKINIVQPIFQNFWEETHPEAPPSAPIDDPDWYKGAAWHQQRAADEQQAQAKKFEREREERFGSENEK